MALTDACHQAVLLLYCHQSSHITDLPFSTATLWQAACPHKMGWVSLQQQPMSSDTWHDLAQQAMGCLFIATTSFWGPTSKMFGWHIYTVHDMAAMWWIWQLSYRWFTKLICFCSWVWNSIWTIVHIRLNHIMHAHTSQLGPNWAAWN